VIPFDRDASTADALLTDLYLDAILAGRPLRGDDEAIRPDVDTPTAGRLNPAIRAASGRLRHDLVRVHPSFRFEERLAARLAHEAAASQLAPAAGAEGSVAAIPVRLDEDEPGDDEGFRPLLIGGALTSAALSIAGAAYVAWRRARPSRPGRAARTTRQRDRGTAARAR
jgi:hypothetical protein